MLNGQSWQAPVFVQKADLFLKRRPLIKRVLLVVAILFVLNSIVNYFTRTGGSGVGGGSFGSIVVQCMFKSYAPIDGYVKSGNKFVNVSHVLSENKGQSGFLSVDFPTDKDDRHNYTLSYDVLVQPYLSQDISILEIGVKKGGSLKLWRELFSPKSTIYGLDIDPAAPTFNRDPNIKVIVADSNDVRLVRSTFSHSQFDIIVDDGDHHANAQYKAFSALQLSLKRTGVYIIEDVIHFKSIWYKAFQGEYSYQILADRSEVERLVVIYPTRSIAPHLSLGLLEQGFF